MTQPLSLPEMISELAAQVGQLRPSLSDRSLAKITELHQIYKAEMLEGSRLQHRAWMMRNEAEGASDGYVEMRAEFRKRAGNDGYGNATNDHKYSQFKEAQAAGKDNAWYMQRVVMDATMATMHFTKAAAIQGDIHRLLMSG